MTHDDRTAPSADDVDTLLAWSAGAGLAPAVPVLAAMARSGELDRLAAIARAMWAKASAETAAAGAPAAPGDGARRADGLAALGQMAAEGDLERLAEVGRLLGTVQDAMTRDMMARLADGLSDGITLSRRLREGDAGRLLDLLDALSATGALPLLVDALPGVLSRIVTVSGWIDAFDAALAKTAAEPPPSGLSAVLRQASGDDGRRAFSLLLEVARQLRKAAA
jgi:hypothetical protein